MTETTWLIGLLAAGTFAMRYAGVVVGRRLPAHGPWARALNALPGCLILSLVTVMLAEAGRESLIGAVVAVAVAVASRSLPATMLAGMATVWLLRGGV